MRPRPLAAIVVIVVLPAGAHAQPLSTRWRPFADSAEKARVAADWPAYARLTDSTYAAGLGNHPSVIWAQARAAARLGAKDRAYERLRIFAAMGLFRSLAADSAFASFAQDVRYHAIDERLRANSAGTTRARLAFLLPDSTLTPESIGYDPPTGRWLFSSIRHGTIVARSRTGAWTTLVDPGRSGLGAHFGLALDPARRVLWVCGQQIPLADGYSPADSGQTGVAAFDLDRGTLLLRVVTPRGPAPHSYGDVAVGPEGQLFVSDAEGGGIYVARRGADSLTTLVPPGILRSPQGIAVAALPHTIYAADYVYGIVRVDTRTGRTDRLPHADSLAVSGIDGLIQVGGALFGVQNGTAPERIVRIELDRTATRITGLRVLEASGAFLDEPTHLVFVQGRIYFIANSGFGKYDADGRPKRGETILRARLGAVDAGPGRRR